MTIFSHKLKTTALIGAFVFAGTVSAFSDPDESILTIEGTTITTDVKAAKDSAFDHLYSGWRFRTKETQSLQMDDFENPAMPTIDIGADLWETVDGSAGKSCASCHNDAETSMKGVRANYPKWSDKIGKPHTLETQINECRKERMGAKEWKWESGEMLAMTGYVGLQSRGMPTKVQTDGPMTKWAAKGKEIYYTRVGQLDLSCAVCHEEYSGTRIRSDHLSQGQINGFPTYRLKWGGLGSIHRRFKGCMKNIRAKPYDVGSDEFIALELYVASRGQGLSVETPAVRN